MAQNTDPLLVDRVLLGQAEQVCRARLQKDPENRGVLRSLGEVYRKMGRLADAATTYQRLSHLDPDDRDAGYLHAVLGGKPWPTSPTGVRPAPFVLLQNFLPKDFREALLPLFVGVSDQFVPVRHNDSYMPEVRQTLEYPHEWAGRREFKNAVRERLASVIPRLLLPPFEVASYTIQVRAYQDGHFFKIHWDAGEPGSRYNSRMINFVYYFHKVPRPYSGGELLVYDTDLEANEVCTTRFTCIVPEDNSIVFFPPNFYHAVLPIRCPSQEFSDSRFTINGHVHRPKDAPPA